RARKGRRRLSGAQAASTKLPPIDAVAAIPARMRRTTRKTTVGIRAMSIDTSLDRRPTPAAPDDDPYLWLEDVDGARALSWVEAQNAATLARFGDKSFAADRDTLAAIYDRPDNLPLVARRGVHLFNFWKDERNPRGLWRRTTMASFRTAEPQWEIVLDLDVLAARESED